MSEDRAGLTGAGRRLAWLRTRRTRMLLTQEELGERAGVDARTIRDIETGRTRNPRASTVRLLMDALTIVEQDSSGSAVEDDRPEPQPGTLRPRELPPDIFGFTGRSEQLAALDHILELAARQPAAVVISAVSGTAGVGKTALAVHWAHQVVDRFPDGQLYVNLRGYDPDQPLQPSDALAGFLRSLGIAGADIPPEQAERARRYRTVLADRRMLILLDNASDVDQVRDLIPGTATCFVLITSRDSLAGLAVHHGGRRIDLNPLPPNEAQALLRAHIGTRVVEEPHAAATLAAQCARLPLALRIAAQLAATRPTVSLAELTIELADEQRRLELLDGGDSRSSAAVVFSWSYRQLPESAGSVFRLLGIRPGRDVDLYATAALAGTDLRDARRQLTILARAHLIQETTYDRYGMHDLLRAYATQQSHVEDQPRIRDAALTRLFDYYLRAAVNAMDMFAPYERHQRPIPADHTSIMPALTDREAAISWLDSERANLIAVAIHAADHGWPTHTSRLSTILRRYLSVGAHFADAAILHKAAMHTPDLDGTRPGLANYGMVLFRLGRLQEALGYNHHALAMVRAAGDRRGEGRVLAHLGCVYSRLGRQPEARDHQRQALSIFRQLGDRHLEAVSLENLGLVYQRMGDYQEACDTQQRALTLYLQLNDPHGEAGVRGNLGVTCSQLGRHQEAREHHKRALIILRDIGDPQHEAETLNDMGTALRILGSHHESIKRHQQALACADNTGDRYDQACAHEGIAQAHHLLGDADAARKHWQTALALHADLGTPQANQIVTRIQALEQSQRQRHG